MQIDHVNFGINCYYDTKGSKKYLTSDIIKFK